MMDMRMIFKFRTKRFGIYAWINVDMVIVQDNLIILPLMQGVEVVFSHYKRKFIRWKFFLQVRQRMHGIIRLWQSEFYIAGFEFRVIFGSEKNHLQSMM